MWIKIFGVVAAYVKIQHQRFYAGLDCEKSVVANERNRTNKTRSKGKRRAPVEVTPVIRNGTRYSAPHFLALSKGMRHNGGYVEATDIRTGNRIWLREVYSVAKTTDLESDVQDLFISTLRIDGDFLIIINENGEEFNIPLTQ